MDKIVTGNDFTLIVDAIQSSAADFDLRLLDTLYIYLTKAGRAKLLQSYALDDYGNAVISVDGEALTTGVWGVEIVGIYDEANIRATTAKAFQIVDGTNITGLSGDGIEITVQVKILANAGSTTYYTDMAIAAHNESGTAHADIRAELAEKITDVKVDTVSVVTDGVANIDTSNFGQVDDVRVGENSIVDPETKIATIDPDGFGRVDDVTVNGDSVVTNKVAAITIPTAVSSLTNDADYQTGADVAQAISNAAIDNVTISVDANIGTPSATANISGDTLNLSFANIKGETGATGNGIASVAQTTSSTESMGRNVTTITMSDGTSSEIEIYNGAKGAQGDSAVFDPDTGNILATLHSTTGEDDANAMTQKAVTEAVADTLLYREIGSGEYSIYNQAALFGTWSYNSSYTRNHGVISVNGEKYVKITANSSYCAMVGFLKSYTMPTTHGASADYCDGYSYPVCPDAGTTAYYPIPSDCNYIVVNFKNHSASGNTDNTPTYIGLGDDARSLMACTSEVKGIRIASNSSSSAYWVTCDAINVKKGKVRITLSGNAVKASGLNNTQSYVFIYAGDENRQEIYQCATFGGSDSDTEIYDNMATLTSRVIETTIAADTAITMMYRISGSFTMSVEQLNDDKMGDSVVTMKSELGYSDVETTAGNTEYTDFSGAPTIPVAAETSRFNTESTTKSAVFINDGYDTVSLTANANYVGVLCFATAFSSTSMTFCGESGRNTITKSTTGTFNVPSDCKYIIISLVEGTYNRTPTSVILHKTETTGALTVINDLMDNAEESQSIAELLGYTEGSEVLEQDTYNDLSAFPTANVAALTNTILANSISAVIPNDGGKLFTMSANSSYNAVAAFVTKYSTATMNYCSASGRVEVTKSKTCSFPIPSDCRYIIVTLLEEGDFNRTPTSVIITHAASVPTLGRLREIESRLSSVETKKVDDVNTRFIAVCNKLCNYVLSLCDANYADTVTVTKTNDFTGSSMFMPLNVANAAVSLAKLLASGYLDTSIIIHLESVIGEYVHKLVVASASAHLANVSDGWGNAWQTPLVCGSLANCVIMCGDLFTDAEKTLVKNMVLSECSYVMGITTQSDIYWANKQGVILNQGDSKSEEDLWNAMPLGAALVLCQDASNYAEIAAKFVELNIIAMATPNDIDSWKTISGYGLANLNGYNVTADGLIHNHNRIHPHYMIAMECSIFETFAALAYNKYLVPIGVLYGKDRVAKAMYQYDFVNTAADTPYEGNGGTIYQSGDWNLYYPQGNDWSDLGQNKMTINEAAFDKCIKLLGIDPSCDWDAWASLHLTLAEYLQGRHADGHLYEDGETTAAVNRRELSACQQITTVLIFLGHKMRMTSSDTWATDNHYILN